MKKISIITINFNNALGLDRTIHSVNSQIFQDFEYVVIDGNSSDGSLSVLEKYSHAIDCLVIEADNGIYHAMNKGVKLATGEFLLFLNSGDVLLTDTILNSISVYLIDSDIVFGDVVWRDGLITNYPKNLNFSFLRNRSLPHQATFIKRNLFEAFGYYDESNKITSDWKFFILCICKYNVSYKKIPWVISKMEPGGISDTQSQNSRNIIFMEKHLVLNSEFKPFLADYELLTKFKLIFSPFTIKFWKRYFSKYRKSTAVSAYDQ